MSVNTYKAQLNYYDHTYGWGNAGTCAQGNGTAYGAGSARTGVLYFPGLAALKDKIINSVKITTTNTASGLNASKTAHFYRSANQGGIKISLGANHKTGSEIGTLTGNFHAYANASLTFTPTFFSQYIALGEDTFCIYSNAAADYLVWSAVTLTVDWSEPATQPTLSASSVELGQPVTITTAATNSAYRHKLRYVFGSSSGTIAEDVESSCNWTPAVSLASQIPNATSGIGTIYCDTYSGTTLLGTKSVGVTLTVPASVKPAAGTLSAAVTDDTSGTGLYVKGMGKAKLTLSGAAGAYGSTIKSYKITGGGWSAPEAELTTGVLTASGEITFTGIVTDSRGRTSDGVICTISVIDYAKPSITSCNVYRCDETGVKKNAGTYVAVEPAISYSSDVPGNALTITAAYRLSDEEYYGASAALTNNIQNIVGGDLSAAKTYSVKITIADSYNTLELDVILSTKSVIMSFLRGLGMAIGKVAELAGWLDIGWHTRMRKNLQVDGVTTLVTALGIGSGGTGAVNAEDARTNLGAAASDHKHDAKDLNPDGLYTDWTLLTLDDAFQAYNGNDNYKPRYKAYGNVVTVRGVVSPKSKFTSSTSLVTMASDLPETLRPKIQLSFICQGSGFNRWQCIIDTDGTISMSRYGITAAEAVPTSAWLTFCCTYIV